MTIKEQIDALIRECQALQSQQTYSQGGAAREFALAITHLEDAQMRATRGLAKLQDSFKPRRPTEGQRMTTEISPQEQASASLDFLYNAADEAVKYLSTATDKDIVQESEDLRFLVQEAIDEIRHAAKRLDDLSVAEFHNRNTKSASEILDELFEKTFGEK